MLSLEQQLMTLEQSTESPPLEDLIGIMQKCRKEKNAECAKRLHSHICNIKLEACGPLGNHLVPMLVECACLWDAEHVFHRMIHPNKYAWNSLIHGYIEIGEFEHAFDLFQQMQELFVQVNMYTLQDLIKACARERFLERGEEVHAVIVKEAFEQDPFVCSTLVDMYCKCGALEEAQDVFSASSVRDVVMWTALIAGYVEHGFAQEALSCFQDLQSEGLSADAFTFVSVLKACGDIQDLAKGKEIHTQIFAEGLEQDCMVGSATLDMYSKCGSLTEAREVFNGLLSRDVVNWTTLITCYAEHGLVDEVWDCLHEMQHEGVSPNAVTYVCSLKVCDGIATIKQGERLHIQIIKEGYEKDEAVSGMLLSMYANCGLLMEAQKIFSYPPVQDVVSWTTLLACCFEHGLAQAAADCLDQMRLKGMHLNYVTLVCILKAYTNARAINLGREIHDEICRHGFEKNRSVWMNLVGMYAKCGNFDEAQEVFKEEVVRDVTSWNVLIAEYAEQGLSLRALDCLDSMLLEGALPNAVTYVHCMKACGSIADMERALALHMKVALDEFEQVPSVGNALVGMYASCGSLLDAQDVFDELQVRDVISWNTLLSVYVDHGHGEETLTWLQQMQLEGVCSDPITFVCSLKACIFTGAIQKGQQIHFEVALEELEVDPFVSCTLLDMYAKLGWLSEARNVFDELPIRDVIHWTALMNGYVEHGLDEEALDLMEEMQLQGVPTNAVTCVSGLKSCGGQGLLGNGRRLHDEIIKKGLDGDHFVGSAVVDMYGQCASLAEALDVFDRLPLRDLICWNALIDGIAECNCAHNVLELLEQMQREGNFPDSVTYVSCLKVCSSSGAICKGQELHSRILKEGYEEDLCVGRMLVKTYAACGFLVEARLVADKLTVRNVALWNTLMAGYIDNGEGEEALTCFERMRSEGLVPDAVSIICALRACGCVGAVNTGFEIQMSISKKEIKEDPALGNNIIDMYASCGSILKAQEFFYKLPTRDTVSWSSLLAGYARLGHSNTVFQLVASMEGEILSPDGVIFLNVLSMCNHTGLVNKGVMIFEAMIRDHAMVSSIEHQNCMLDLLGRTGQVAEALELIEVNILQPNVQTWITIVTFSQRWGHVGLAKYAFQCMVRQDKNGAAPAFILMSNTYADEC